MYIILIKNNNNDNGNNNIYIKYITNMFDVINMHSCISMHKCITSRWVKFFNGDGAQLAPRRSEPADRPGWKIIVFFMADLPANYLWLPENTYRIAKIPWINGWSAMTALLDWFFLEILLTSVPKMKKCGHEPPKWDCENCKTMS